MSQKRSWPGVPKRQSTRRPPRVIRPKSMATVVVVLFSTPCRSSWLALTLVRASSVRSGRTSLIALTSVVFPAPKPPAMRILKTDGGPAAPSEGAEPMEHLPQQLSAGLLAGATGQALHPRRQYRQPLRLIPAQPRGRRDSQPVPGQDHGLAEVLNPVGQVVEEPAQVLAGSRSLLLPHDVFSLSRAGSPV